MECSLIFVTTFVLVALISGAESTNFNIKNNCPYTIWPATLSNNNSPQLSDTGFELAQGATRTISAPAGWAGRIWARTYCQTDGSGRFQCPVGDCGTGQVTCNGKGGAAPVSLAQIVLNGNNGAQDAYDVSLVDGFNLPVTIAPVGCQVSSCPVDINAMCPANMVAARASNGGVIGCKNDPELFKAKCPQTFGACPSGKDYLITFCP